MTQTGWLLLFFAVFYLLPLDLQPLWMPDETRYAEISREMVSSGDWVVPHLLGLRYFEKPIAGYWLNSLSQLLLGESNFSVRFASSVSTLLSALLVVWFALRLWGDRKRAFAAGLIYLSCLLVYGIGSYSELDAIFTLWINAIMLSLYLACSARRVSGKVLAWLGVGVVCGMAFLTKGFIALALPVIVALPYMIWQRRFRELLCFGPLAILSAVIISAPWALLVAQREPDFWNYFFWVEHIQRFSASNAQHKSPFWYYIPILILGLIPWLGLLPGLLQRQWRSRFVRAEYGYLALWVLMPLLFFSVAKGKLLTYILPCFAPMALLLAVVLCDMLQQKNLRLLKINAWLNGLLALVAAGTLVFASYEIYSVLESYKLSIGMGIFSLCLLLALGQLKNPARLWPLNAFISVILGLGVIMALPRTVIDSKMPQPFINAHLAELNKARWLVSNNTGVASALAWETQNSNIILLNVQGELKYGLGYDDVGQRYVTNDHFAAWLSQARRTGDVAVLLRSKNKNDVIKLPKADQQMTQYRFILLIYRQSHG
ncbi:MAG: lipid IV(A) 4-amino-4-deoxy-L-arabinosyltransferase [Enterobacteriaceae bacterium]